MKKKSILVNKLKAESFLVRVNSMKVLKEFEDHEIIDNNLIAKTNENILNYKYKTK